MQSHTIAVLGSGTVGTTLAGGFIKHGHSVILASREPDKPEVHAWVDEHGERACSANYEDAVGAADWVVLAIPGEVAEKTLRGLGEGLLGGKLLIDVSNNLGTGEHGQISLPMGLEDSAAQRIQRDMPSVRIVKAFNSTGYQSMIDPQPECAPPDMPICGDDEDAKAQVGELLRELGWDPVDLGGIEFVPLIEAMTAAWVRVGRATGRWDHCYKFVRP